MIWGTKIITADGKEYILLFDEITLEKGPDVTIISTLQKVLLIMRVLEEKQNQQIIEYYLFVWSV